MQEFFAKLFSQNNSSLSIGLFDIWHFMYLFIIIGGSVGLAFLYKNKSKTKREKLVRLFAYLAIGMYIADFFIMPLSDSYNGISAYKLPFNICTIMAVLVPFVQFNPKFSKLKTVIVTLSIASSLMWMCYPGTALGGQPPFCYIIFQTFMYHGLLFAWGFLNLALDLVRLDWRKLWKEFLFILAILVWAAFGNAVYPGEYNWFFIEKSIFPFLTDSIMPLMVVACVFGTVFVVYCAFFGYKALLKKLRKKQPAR